MLPESTDSCSWGPSDHDVFLEVSPAFTLQDREKPSGAFCPRVSHLCPFTGTSWVGSCLLVAQRDSQLSSQYHGQCPAIPGIAWLRAILLPSPSLHAHIASLPRETQWQALSCGWETLSELSPLEAQQPTLMTVFSQAPKDYGPPFLGISKIGRQ